jgi:hypothetical protein
MSPSGGSYSEGKTITLIAEADSGYSFTGWGNISSYSEDYATSQSIEFVMPASAVEISAGFTTSEEGWTFMIYMAGDNSLSDYVSKDINEIEQGLENAYESGNSSIADDVKVLILSDTSGSSDSKLYLASPDSNIFSIASTRIIDDDYSSSCELDMADPDTLEHFVSYSMANYPSAHNALVIWNHGGGVKSLETSVEPTKIVCQDGSDYLYTNEIQTALNNSLGNSSLDIFGYDACLMGDVESAYEFRDLSDYFIASMAEEWGYGWDYEEIFNNFSTAGTIPSAATIATVLVTQYRDSTISATDSIIHTMTAVDTSELEDLKAALDSLAALIYDFSGSSDSQDIFEDVRDDSVPFYEQRPSNVTETSGDKYEQYILAYPYHDLYDFCNEIIASDDYKTDTNLTAQAQTVLDELDDAVVACYGNSSSYDASSAYVDDLDLSYYSVSDSSAARGLSIFIPHGELFYNGYSHYAYDFWYTSEILDDYDYGELDFCTSYSDTIVGTWRELFEAWYDPEDIYTTGTF